MCGHHYEIAAMMPHCVMNHQARLSSGNERIHLQTRERIAAKTPQTIFLAGELLLRRRQIRQGVFAGQDRKPDAGVDQQELSVKVRHCVANIRNDRAARIGIVDLSRQSRNVLFPAK
jgi:hypothetical protein